MHFYTYTCSSGKRRFASEADARGEMYFLKERKKSRRSKDYKKLERVYRCPKCDGWHLTSSKTKPLLRDKRRKSLAA